MLDVQTVAHESDGNRPARKQAKTTRNTWPGRESATSAPQDATDGAERAEAKRESQASPMPLPLQDHGSPTTAVGRTTRSEVASAACWERPVTRVRNGTIMMPPPTPSKSRRTAGQEPRSRRVSRKERAPLTG